MPERLIHFANALPKRSAIRSFVIRQSRMSLQQKQAVIDFWPRFGVELGTQTVASHDALTTLFGRDAPCYAEIGFGFGHSFEAFAQAHPEWNIIGIETHKPGVGALLARFAQSSAAHAFSHVRLYMSDAICVLRDAIPDTALAGITIFFPDPWPKRRHHARRIIQPAFLDLLWQKLKAQGTVHLATDHADYAQHMLRVFEADHRFINTAACPPFAARSPFRPIISKFEQRALLKQHAIFELQWQKIEP